MPCWANGAGKSTLFALLTRLFTTRDGTIRIAGHDLAMDARAAMARIGVVFQQSTLDLDLSVRRNLCISQPCTDWQVQLLQSAQRKCWRSWTWVRGPANGHAI